MGTARWFAVTVEAIPIPQAIENGSRVDVMVDELLAAVDDGAAEQVDALESAIDQLVYESYGLTERQRHVIKR